jgi:small-conductance mechanosensitive channel
LISHWIWVDSLVLTSDRIMLVDITLNDVLELPFRKITVAGVFLVGLLGACALAVVLMFVTPPWRNG